VGWTFARIDGCPSAMVTTSSSTTFLPPSSRLSTTRPDSVSGRPAMSGRRNATRMLFRFDSGPAQFDTNCVSHAILSTPGTSAPPNPWRRPASASRNAGFVGLSRPKKSIAASSVGVRSIGSTSSSTLMSSK
jgi:hypothetical protein